MKLDSLWEMNTQKKNSKCLQIQFQLSEFRVIQV